MKKNVIRDFYDIEYLVDINHFVELLFISLANNKLLYNYNMKKDHEIIDIPADYKNRIQNIMYDEKSKILNISKIIDIEKYYSDQKRWENELDEAIKKYSLEKINTTTDKESYKIKISINEIKSVLLKYDCDILDIASYFADLLVNLEKINTLEVINNIHIKEISL